MVHPQPRSLQNRRVNALRHHRMRQRNKLQRASLFLGSTSTRTSFFQVTFLNQRIRTQVLRPRRSLRTYKIKGNFSSIIRVGDRNQT